MLRNYFTFSRFTLFIALCISTIAAWYSVIGLTAIFAGAVVPIIIMGGILEVAKITTTVWLHRYWDRAGYAIRTYLTIAVISLACLTSMGIFGLLSKAHLEQGVVSGDVGSRVGLLDEKIKVARENIDANRKALRQLDEAVDQVMGRSTTETGADKAVQIRRSQSKERTRLLQEIEAEQKKIGAFNEERAPIASQLRKVEAEVGPIRYIAALVYGDNPDVSTLEKAVRWVIILIVAVFDPLAIILILAANNSLKWEREDRVKSLIEDDGAAMAIVPPEPTQTRPFTEQEIEALDGITEQPQQVADDTTKEIDVSGMTPWPTEWSDSVPSDITLEPIVDQVQSIVDNPLISSDGTNTLLDPINMELLDKGNQIEKKDIDVVTDGVTERAVLYSSNSDYVVHDGKTISTVALKELAPELVINGPIINDILFGPQFPTVAKTGDIYTRVDCLPHKTYKFNGLRWMQLNREENSTYLQNIAYVQYLIAKIDTGEYDPDWLTALEQDEIKDYLKRST